MNKSLATLIATATAAVATFSLGAQAQSTATPPPAGMNSGPTSTAATTPGTPGTTTTTTVTTETVDTKLVPAPTLSHSEAKDMKTQSKADYKARKNIAEANHDLNKADCKINASGAVERACKSDARAQEKKEKADANLIHKSETADIKAQTN